MTFVIDSNVLIEAYHRYYAFDLAPKFWDEIISHMDNGDIICIDPVRKELTDGNDTLAEWVKKCHCTFTPSTDPETLKIYGELMQWAVNEEKFLPKALTDFATVADAWIVAFAAAHNCTVTTLEVSDKAIKKRIKIPDVCEAFSVPYVDTFSMLKKLKVKFA